MFSLPQPSVPRLMFFFLPREDGLSLYSQVYQAADRKDADEEAGQLTHSGPRQEEAQGDTGQAQGKNKSVE